MPNNLPNLKIVSLSQLIVHEDVDQKRINQLTAKIKKDDIFTNPPMVVKLRQSNKYVVLDGANRTQVFNNLGFRDMVVQIVDYHDQHIELKTWNHLIYGIDPKPLLDKLKSGRSFKIRRHLIICPKIKQNFFLKQINYLNELAGSYKAKYKFHRLDGSDLSNFTLPRSYTLVIYPELKPQDIISLVKNHQRAPSGITRHIIVGRALRIDIPMSLLQSKQSLSIKNRKLNALIKTRLENNKIRYYQEPVYIFSE